MSSSGGSAPATNAPGAFPVTGLLSPKGGVNTSSHGAYSHVAVVSGTGFVPSATDDCFVMVQIEAGGGGTVDVSYGPVTGTEHDWFVTTPVVAGNILTIPMYVPAGWTVLMTTTAALGESEASIHAL